MLSSLFRTFGAACMALAAGCTVLPPKDPVAGAAPGLSESAWVMGDAAGVEQAEGPFATLRFEGGRVMGSDGCNRYSAPYTAAPGKLLIGAPRIATQMACPEEDQAQMAMAFNRALDEVRSYRMEGGSLVFVDATGAALAQFSPQPVTLAGSAWQVNAYNNGKQAVVGVIAGTQLTLEFAADGRLRGSAGCNRFIGAYSADGARLAIAGLSSTRMACAEPEGRMAQEAAFLRALESVATARREADKLELRTAADALALSATLVRAAKP